jgi:hypothetical protein
VRLCAVLFSVVLLIPTAGYAQDDALGDARQFYNSRQYEAAEQTARTALEQPATANRARLVLGRIHLERYRETDLPSHLTEARVALRDVDPGGLDARERLELTVGLAETLFLEDRFAAAAELFAPVLDASLALGPAAHERVLDWWASSLDRHAQLRPVAERPALYERIAMQMQAELVEEPGSATAGYWAVAAMRGGGHAEGAWNAAMAAWVRAALGADRGAALRADLDRMVIDGIIPDRAARLELKDTSRAIAGMLSEWELFKSDWTPRMPNAKR